MHFKSKIAVAGAEPRSCEQTFVFHVPFKFSAKLVAERLDAFGAYCLEKNRLGNIDSVVFFGETVDFRSDGGGKTIASSQSLRFLARPLLLTLVKPKSTPSSEILTGTRQRDSARKTAAHFHTFVKQFFEA